MKYEIDIEIRPDGTVGFGVKGAKGKKCKEITKFLEEALGDVSQVEYTPEYYEAEVVEQEKVKVER